MNEIILLSLKKKNILQETTFNNIDSIFFLLRNEGDTYSFVVPISKL